MSKLTLDRILHTQGFGTRKGCRELIGSGHITIDEAIITDTQTPIETDELTFFCSGEPWLFRQQIYVALNKPAHFECSRKPSHHPGVLTLLPEQFTRRNVQPVGRLDHDTTGLLLMSDDGAFIHTQSSPKRSIPKIYVATTFDPITPELIARLLNGVQLHDEPKPLAARHCERIDEHHLKIILAQGKYHQVKRMLAAAENHCTALNRAQIGNLRLDDLKLAAGEWCYLDTAQLARLAPPFTLSTL
ncbi:MAG: 16S rRNA pseudouridine(516) synthase [Gallionella sp.]